MLGFQRSCWYPLSGRLAGMQNQSGDLGENKHSFLLLGVKPQVFYCLKM
jgi:hypothetical protein